MPTRVVPGYEEWMGQIPGPVNEIFATYMAALEVDIQTLEAGAVGGKTVDTASLTNSDDKVPSSKLLRTLFAGEAHGATITLAGANTDASREATIQLKDINGTNLAVKGGVLIYATGEAGAADTGVLAARGTDFDTLEVKAANGLQIAPALGGTDKGIFHAVSTAAGAIVLTFADASANISIFLHVILPTGEVVDSTQFEVNHA